MSAIAGVVGGGGHFSRERLCSEMLQSLSPFGRDGCDVRSLETASFGRNLAKILPEDDWDEQPLIGGGGRYLLTADVRIDNRRELAAKLGLGRAQETRMSDAALLLAAWERWSLSACDHLLGDYAAAVWDTDDRVLTLVRSPFAIKPLFYHLGKRGASFASMPAGLRAVPAAAKAPNLRSAAAIAMQLPFPGRYSLFEGVEQVPQGHAVRLNGSRVDVMPIWTFSRDRLRIRSLAEAAEALRAEVDRAVAAQLRRHHGGVAAQLSAGRDSSAVATSAATVAELTAFTGAPLEGAGLPDMPGYLSDESEIAAATATQHNVMRHVVCRPQPGSALATLDLLQALNHSPLLGPSQLPWWAAINDRAKAAGATVLLAGSSGNFTASAGGLGPMRDLWLEEGAAKWLRKAAAIAGLSPARWRSIGSVTFGPALPKPAYFQLLRLGGRGSSDPVRFPLLRDTWRKRAEEFAEAQWSDPRPPPSHYQFRIDTLMEREHPDKISYATWGLDPRDPLSDRRLVDFCLSLPPDLLVSDPKRRPLFELAFGSRISHRALGEGRRGYQSADWYRHFTRGDVRRSFDEIRNHSLVCDLFDFGHIDGVIERWPADGWGRLDVIYEYRNLLLSSLAVGRFLAQHFPE